MKMLSKKPLILIIIYLFKFSIDTNTNQQIIYKGCFNDTQNSDLNKMTWKNLTNMNINLCVNYCFDNRYPYAGLQDG
jgi:hypothetical protein